MKYEIERGSFDGYAWICVDYELHIVDADHVSDVSEVTLPCPHCHSIRLVKNFNFSEYVCTCPAVVIAESDDPYCMSAVCLDCLIGAKAKLDCGVLEPYVEEEAKVEPVSWSTVGGSIATFGNRYGA